MLRLKIEVSDGLLDLFEGTDNSFYITKQLNDLHNLQNRQADFTRQIDIPRTPNNETLLGLDTNETLVNTSLSCNILLDETLVIPYARLLIVNHSPNTKISIAIFSGNYELFDNIPNDSIRGLDFNSLNFQWTVAEIDNHKANTSDVLTSMVGWFNEESMNNGVLVPASLTTQSSISNFGFFFHCKDIVKKIVSDAGYVLDDTAISTDDTYKDLVLACPVLADAPLVLITARWDLNGAWDYDDTFLGLPERVPFDTIISDASALWNNTTKEYVITTQDDYIFTFDYIFDFDAVTTEGGFIDILKNGVTIVGDSIQAIDQTGVAGVLRATTTCQVGDAIYVEVSAGYKNGAQYDTLTIYANSFFNLAQDSDDPTAELVVSEWLPDISQKVFLKNFLSIFNALIDASPINKKAVILSWNDYITETSQDITNSVDARQEIVSEASMSGYYRRSLMDYDSDELHRTDVPYEVDFNKDDALPPYGTILQLVDWGGSDDSKEFIGTMETGAIELNYRSVPGFSIINTSFNFTFAKAEDFEVGDYIYYGGNRIDRIQVVASKTAGTFFNAAGATYAAVDVEVVKFTGASIKPRVGIVNRSGVFIANFTSNGYGGTLPSTPVTLTEVEFNIQMVVIHHTYYKQLFDALQTPKIVNVWMNFSVDEFIALDMLKPVFIAYLNGYFYINKISQFKLNAPCLVELIRINKLI